MCTSYRSVKYETKIADIIYFALNLFLSRNNLNEETVDSDCLVLYRIGLLLTLSSVTCIVFASNSISRGKRKETPISSKNLYCSKE